MGKKRKNNQKYILLAAVTIDGKIARHRHHLSSDWTSRADKKHLRQILDQAEIIIVGNKTYKTAYRPLAKRNCLVLTRSIDKTLQKTDNCLYCNPEKVSLKKILAERGYKNICLLGGTATYSLALAKGLVDEIYLTIEPYIFGSGLNLFDLKIKNKQSYKLISVKKLNKRGTVLLHYKK